MRPQTHTSRATAHIPKKKTPNSRIAVKTLYVFIQRAYSERVCCLENRKSKTERDGMKFGNVHMSELNWVDRTASSTKQKNRISMPRSVCESIKYNSVNVTYAYIALHRHKCTDTDQIPCRVKTLAAVYVNGIHKAAQSAHLQTSHSRYRVEFKQSVFFVCMEHRYMRERKKTENDTHNTFDCDYIAPRQ